MALRLRGATSGYIELKAPASAGDNTLTLPVNNGSANQILKTDGNGNLSWVDDANTQLTFANDSNNRVITGTGSGLNAEANFTFDGNDLTISHSGLAVNIFESTDNHSRLRIKSGDSSLAQLEFADQSDADAGEIRYDHVNDVMTFHVGNNAERLRIDSSGRILFGTTSSTRETSLVLVGNSNSYTTNPGVIDLFIGNTPSNLGGMGQICFGTQNVVGARIDGRADQDWTLASARGTHLRFLTCANGSTTLTERLRIDNAGNTHFGSGAAIAAQNTVSIIPSEGRINFGMDGRDALVTGESGCYIFSGDGPSGSPLAGELIIQSRSNVDRDIFFATGSSPAFRARFRGSDGDFFFGNDLATITNIGTSFRENDSGSSYMEMGHGTTGAAYSYLICRFGASGTHIGGIAQNNDGTGVTFQTSSDYRLKTNETSITDGITRIKQLKPYQFEWKSNLGKKVDGFFAHEVSSIVPEAITGTKDEVETTYYDEEKNLPEGKSIGDIKESNRPVYQKIDQSKLVPLLTAALKEAIAKIETLETKVAALESA